MVETWIETNMMFASVRYSNAHILAALAGRWWEASVAQCVEWQQSSSGKCAVVVSMLVVDATEANRANRIDLAGRVSEGRMLSSDDSPAHYPESAMKTLAGKKDSLPDFHAADTTTAPCRRYRRRRSRR